MIADGFVPSILSQNKRYPAACKAQHMGMCWHHTGTLHACPRSKLDLVACTHVCTTEAAPSGIPQRAASNRGSEVDFKILRLLWEPHACAWPMVWWRQQLQTCAAGIGVQAWISSKVVAGCGLHIGCCESPGAAAIIVTQASRLSH